MSDILSIELIDKNPITNDVMGKFELNLKKVNPTTISSGWFPLISPGRKGNEVGEIFLVYELVTVYHSYYTYIRKPVH